MHRHTTFLLLIVALFLAVAVIPTFALEKYLTILLASPVSAVVVALTSVTVADTVGLLFTTKALNVHVLVPMLVFPLNVSHVIVPSALIAFGILAKNDVGIVHPILVFEVFVAIVPVSPLKAVS